MTRMTRKEAAEILDGRNIVDRAAYLEALEVAANALCESAALPAAPKKKPLPRKCSTCADRDCRQRGRICDWKHCKDWKEGPRKA